MQKKPATKSAPKPVLKDLKTRKSIKGGGGPVSSPSALSSPSAASSPSGN